MSAPGAGLVNSRVRVSSLPPGLYMNPLCLQPFPILRSENCTCLRNRSKVTSRTIPWLYVCGEGGAEAHPLSEKGCYM